MRDFKLVLLQIELKNRTEKKSGCHTRNDLDIGTDGSVWPSWAPRQVGELATVVSVFGDG